MKNVSSTILFPLAISFLVLIPFLALSIYIFQSSQVWEHIVDTILIHQSINSILLVLGIGGLSLLFGVSTAYCLTFYDFVGKNILQYALLLPLSFPPYIIAFCYVGLFDFTGFDVMNFPFFILLFSSVIYPYVYLVVKDSFQQISSSYLETAKIYGKTNLQSFISVLLPLTRPALVAGFVLVSMEVLNDYGAMKYFGINTFTTGIYQAWFSFGEIQAAVKLSGLLMMIVLSLIVIEQISRRNKRYSSVGSSSSKIRPLRASPILSLFLLFICLLPILIGFILPLGQLIVWASRTYQKVQLPYLFKLIQNSFLLAIIPATAITFVAVLLVYFSRIAKNKLSMYLIKISTVGYVTPGAVLAVGILIIYGLWQQSAFLSTKSSDTLFLTLLCFLIFGYFIRFFALGVQPIDSTLEKVNKNLEEAAFTLGANKWRTLFQINLPILKSTLFTAFTLITVNILKELPLSLIIRPFNFDTLAIKSYELAKDEQIAIAANYALILVLVGTLPVYLLSQSFSRK